MSTIKETFYLTPIGKINDIRLFSASWLLLNDYEKQQLISFAEFLETITGQEVYAVYINPNRDYERLLHGVKFLFKDHKKGVEVYAP